MLRYVLPSLLGLLSGSLAAADISGALAAGDQQLDSGEYADLLTHPIAAGEHLQITMSGQDGLDAYLQVRMPDGSVFEIDDSQGLRLDARVQVLSAVAGDMQIMATSSRPGETGTYQISITTIERVTLSDTGSREGSLAAGDEQMDSGEWYDLIPFQGTAGQRVMIRATSDAIDPYLILIGPNGEREEVDDSEGFLTNCLIDHRLESAGEWQIAVTSAAAGESGAYDLTVWSIAGAQQAQAGSGAPVQATSQRQFSGQLAAGDAQLSNGEFYDHYLYPATAGQTLTARMTSTAIDSYLVIVDPTGQQHDNNDSNGRDAELSVTATEDGNWRVIATSMQAAETGAYNLTLDGLLERLGEIHQGTLAGDDIQMESGEYYDRLDVQVAAGEQFDIYLSGSGFDPYLILIGPDGQQFDNDDGTHTGTASHLTYTATEAGTLGIIATSLHAGETGTWECFLHRNAGTSSGHDNIVTGSLAAGDELMESGEWYDRYPLSVEAGERITVELQSDTFDTYLIVQNTDGEQLDNDDYQGDRTRSLITLEAASAGDLLVVPTTYAPNAGGDYRLRITRSTRSGDTQPSSNTIAGELADDDRTTDRGAAYDMHTFQGQPGQRAQIELTATAFDPYLMVISPSGVTLENDDAPGMGRNSALDMPITETGTYRILATAYQTGGRGTYELTTRLSTDQRDTTADLTRLAIGETTAGSLTADDPRGTRNRAQDSFVIAGEAGESFTIDLRSQAFDPFLTVEMPDGSVIDNDDFQGSRTHSQVVATLPSSGRLRIRVSAYSTTGTGAYQLIATRGSSVTTPTTSGSGANFYALCIGLSDYPGTANDLAYCAEDAERMADALVNGVGMPASNAIVLTDSGATRDGMRQAMAQLAQRCTDQDTLVFFYSGHGDRHDRQDGWQAADPDAVDESLALYDGYVMDDELHVLLEQIPARVQLVALDSCFSGGFAKDLISVPGRMGLFSSEEDVPSNVAAKFRAGGYLSLFLKHAVGERLADANSDDQISVLELSQYIHEQYRSQVKSSTPRTGASAAAFVREADLGYQHLVVDRGSISHDYILIPSR